MGIIYTIPVKEEDKLSNLLLHKKYSKIVPEIKFIWNKRLEELKCEKFLPLMN